MALQLNRTQCCGLRELHGIQHRVNTDYDWQDGRLPTPEEIVDFVKHQMFLNRRNGAFITFAAATGNDGGMTQGRKLATFIRKHKLGELSNMEPARNPNSNHDLVVWLWRVDRVAMKKFKPKEKS